MVSLSPEEDARLKAFARARGVNVNSVLRHLVSQLEIPGNGVSIQPPPDGLGFNLINVRES